MVAGHYGKIMASVQLLVVVVSKFPNAHAQIPHQHTEEKNV